MTPPDVSLLLFDITSHFVEPAKQYPVFATNELYCDMTYSLIDGAIHTDPDGTNGGAVNLLTNSLVTFDPLTRLVTFGSTNNNDEGIYSLQFCAKTYDLALATCSAQIDVEVHPMCTTDYESLLILPVKDDSARWDSITNQYFDQYHSFFAKETRKMLTDTTLLSISRPTCWVESTKLEVVDGPLIIDSVPVVYPVEINNALPTTFVDIFSYDPVTAYDRATNAYTGTGTFEIETSTNKYTYFLTGPGPTATYKPYKLRHSVTFRGGNLYFNDFDFYLWPNCDPAFVNLQDPWLTASYPIVDYYIS